MTIAKRRPRRIAADEAHSWARHLRLRNPGAKDVLKNLTIYVDGEGCCWVGIPSLAEDLEMSPDTIRRRLAWLEMVGAISREPQWIDEYGARNGQQRGRRTTDKIRLLFEADVDAIEARAAGETVDAENHAVSTASDPSKLRGSDPPAGTRLGLGRPSQSCEGLISEPEPEDSPQAPLGGGREPDQSEEGEGEPEHFAEAWDAWPAKLRRDLALSEFAKLAPDDRALCRAAIPHFLKMLRDLRRNHVPNFHLWIRTRGFDEFPNAGKPAEKPAQPTRRFVQGEELKGLQVAVAIAERRDLPLVQDQTLGWGYWTGIAPQPDLVAMASYAGADRDGWLIVEPGTPQFAAWRDRFKLWLGVEPQAERIFLEPFDPNVHGVSSSHPNFRLRKAKSGFRVPRDYPPRRDGKWSGESE
ncbi:hypothetical protein [Bradyrhizobium sp. USDA 4452]